MVDKIKNAIFDLGGIKRRDLTASLCSSLSSSGIWSNMMFVNFVNTFTGIEQISKGLTRPTLSLFRRWIHRCLRETTDDQLDKFFFKNPFQASCVAS